MYCIVTFYSIVTIQLMLMRTISRPTVPQTGYCTAFIDTYRDCTGHTRLLCSVKRIQCMCMTLALAIQVHTSGCSACMQCVTLLRCSVQVHS